MKTLLSLRQNKIIQILRGSKSHMTSEEISKALNVSSKTVRTDIADINNALSQEGIFIDSVKGKGFILHVDNPELLIRISKDHKIFFGQEDRVFYIAGRLCTSEGSINLYDLEDEISVSSSTLSGDLNAFKKRFVHNVPYIKLRTEKNELLLEDNELKRRFIMVKLLIDNWDYHSTGRFYYQSNLIDDAVFQTINSTTAGVLSGHGIVLDDYSLISLNLYLAITHERLRQGHELSSLMLNAPLHPSIDRARRELFAVLEDKLAFKFPEIEQLVAACFISMNRLLTREDFEHRVFPDHYYDTADRFITLIQETFGLDLNGEEEFYHRLISFITWLYHPMKDLTVRDSPDHIKRNLFVEFIISTLFLNIADSKCDITENDLLYLTWAVFGAVLHFEQDHPDRKFNTVVLCHTNIHSMWAANVALQANFGGYLNVVDVIPVNQKDFYDYSGADLILSTVDKNLSAPDTKKVIQISPYLSRTDISNISNWIRVLKISRFFPENIISVSKLLENAFVHERQTFSSRSSLIEFMCREFEENGIFTDDHMINILNREAITSYASNPALLMIYSTVPAAKTHLSVVTLEHRLKWNKYKIRVIFMVALAKEDMNELFYLQNLLFQEHFDPDIIKHFKTIDEIRDYYSGIE